MLRFLKNSLLITNIYYSVHLSFQLNITKIDEIHFFGNPRFYALPE
jgi:hypothetical protein